MCKDVFVCKRMSVRVCVSKQQTMPASLPSCLPCTGLLPTVCYCASWLSTFAPNSSENFNMCSHLLGDGGGALGTVVLGDTGFEEIFITEVYSSRVSWLVSY